MARKNDLAKLAALAGLGYVLTNQYRNKVDLTETKDSNPDRKARPDSTEDRLESPEDTIKRSIQKAPLDGTEMYPSGVMGGARMADAIPARSLRQNTPITTDNTTANAYPRMPGGALSSDQGPSAPDYGNEGLRSKSPELMAMNEANGADSRSANRGDQLADVSRAVNREAKTSKTAQGEFSDITRDYKNYDGTPAVKNQEMYDTLNKKSGANTSSARKTDALAVASRAARAADAKRRAARQSSYKSGGMVAKASSASSRADGIASKGKTRGKIC